MRTYNHHMVAGEWVTATNDMADFEVVGEFTVLQIAAVDVYAAVGLMDQVSVEIGSWISVKRQCSVCLA
jgi:hypothetical protein